MAPRVSHPESRHRDFLLFVRAGSRSRGPSTRVVELHLLCRGQPRVLHLPRRSRELQSSSHQQVATTLRVAAMTSARSMTAYPEAPESSLLAVAAIVSRHGEVIDNNGDVPSICELDPWSFFFFLL
ncbi:hypothetical protein F2Q69_00050109 [Brassica cretica]|uniref:Uncharacterized protein n=1 Tax=Brassica cretica TaxID=69181 RepID=A0A8S9PTP0_BRACR|nr:hypothetical protein F2Q69_00050109 [Brassica cretica]